MQGGCQTEVKVSWHSGKKKRQYETYRKSQNRRIRHCWFRLFRSISFIPYYLFVTLTRQLNAIGVKPTANRQLHPADSGCSGSALLQECDLSGVIDMVPDDPAKHKADRIVLTGNRLSQRRIGQSGDRLM